MTYQQKSSLRDPGTSRVATGLKWHKSSASAAPDTNTWNEKTEAAPIPPPKKVGGMQRSKDTSCKRKLSLPEKFVIFQSEDWTSLVAQWLRIRLPMQGTRVRALVQEDPTCRGATKPVRHNY